MNVQITKVEVAIMVSHRPLQKRRWRHVIGIKLRVNNLIINATAPLQQDEDHPCSQQS